MPVRDLLDDNNGPRRFNRSGSNRDGLIRKGDMRLTEFQYKYHFGTEEERKEVMDRQAISDTSYRWPNGEVVYAYHSMITNQEINLIEQAIAQLNNNLGGCPRLR